MKNLAALLSASHADTEPQSHITFGYFQPHMCKGPPACTHHWRPLTFLWCTQTSAHLNSCLLLSHFSLRSMATHTGRVCFHMCSPELPSSCPGVALSRASQYGCFKPKKWRGATRQIACMSALVRFMAFHILGSARVLCGAQNRFPSRCVPLAPAPSLLFSC